jgi:hypothetical protein
VSAKTLTDETGKAERLVKAAVACGGTILTEDEEHADAIRSTVNRLRRNVRVMTLERYLAGDEADKSGRVFAYGSDDVLDLMARHGVSAIALDGAML